MLPLSLQPNTIKAFLVLSIVIVLFAFTGITAFAAWAPAGTTPPNEPTGPTPQDQYYHPIVTTPAGLQEKAGKLGVGAGPANEYDFNVDGIGSFLGGVWASAGVFLNNVCIGTPIIPTAFCPAGGNSSTLHISGTFKSQGDSANIQNDRLRHTTNLANGQAGLERVCSTATGVLRLCSYTTPPPTWQGGGEVMEINPGLPTSAGGGLNPGTPSGNTAGSSGAGTVNPNIPTSATGATGTGRSTINPTSGGATGAFGG